MKWAAWRSASAASGRKDQKDWKSCALTSYSSTVVGTPQRRARSASSCVPPGELVARGCLDQHRRQAAEIGDHRVGGGIVERMVAEIGGLEAVMLLGVVNLGYVPA